MPLTSSWVPLAARAARAAVPPAVLSAASLQQFADDGFVAIPALCSTADLARIRSILLSCFLRRVGRDEGSQFDMLGRDLDPALARQPQLIKPSEFAPELLRTGYFGRLTGAARQLLGPDARFSFDHSILKPARSAAATPWHQDEAHHKHRQVRFAQVSFWMPLQDTGFDAGCMCYIPGSGRSLLLPHRHLDDDSRLHAIECLPEGFDQSLAVAVPAAAGTCIVHGGRTIHSALPNVSESDRLAYIVAFTAPPILDRLVRNVLPASGLTANRRRRAHWMLRGGFVISTLRRLRQGLRSSPRALSRKLLLLLAAIG